jgi:hypothetical protein
MNLEIHAVTVCVNYSHLLKYTIEANRHFFKRWVIVTHKKDLDTIELCKKHNLEYILSKTLYMRQFFKSGAINEGIEYLGDAEWILHIDADIVLPQNFPEVFKGDESGRPLIRGSYRNWPDGKGKTFTTHRFRKYIDMPILSPLLFCMGRVNVDKDEDLEKLNIQKYFDQEDKIVQSHKGYGFFQLWHNPTFKQFYHQNLQYIYPTQSKNAGADDWIFSKLFNKVVSLSTYCVHLSPEEVNWDGISLGAVGPTYTMKEYKKMKK